MPERDVTMKMRENLKPLLFWKGMKEDIVKYVARCLECQQVKDEHRHPAGLLQPHTFLESNGRLFWWILLLNYHWWQGNVTQFCGSRHSDEEFSIYSCAYDVSGTWHSYSFHQWYCEAAWHAKEDYIRSRINVYWMILDWFPRGLGNPT